jgi:hypothetical protein
MENFKIGDRIIPQKKFREDPYSDNSGKLTFKCKENLPKSWIDISFFEKVDAVSIDDLMNALTKLEERMKDGNLL